MTKMVLKMPTQKTSPTAFDRLYLCFFILLPIIYSSQLVDIYLIPRQLFLTVFVMIVGLISFFEIQANKMRADFSFLKLLLPKLLFVFLISILISFAQSIVIAESIYVLSKASIVTLFYAMTAYLLIQEKLHIQYLIKAILGFCSIIVLIAIYQSVQLYFSGIDFWNNVHLIIATTGNKNLLSSILFLTLPFLFSVVLLNKKWRIFSVFLFFIMLMLLWVVQTKAVLVAILILAVVLSLFSIKYIKENIHRRVVKFALVLIASFAMVVGFVTIQNKDKFIRVFDTHSATSRFLIWENSSEMIQENPVFGVGAGNWPIHFPKYGLGKFNSEQQNGLAVNLRPHNDFLWVFCEMGIIGIVTYVFVFLLVLFCLFKLLQKSDNWTDHWINAVFFGVLIGYMEIAFVDFPLERVEHQILLYLIFSVVTYRYFVRFGVEKPLDNTRRLYRLFMAAFVLVSLFSMVVSIDRYKGEFHTRMVYAAQQKSNWVQLVREADLAMNYFYTIDPKAVPINYYKGVGLFSTGNMALAEESFEKAYKLHPYNIHLLNNYASSCEILGDHKRAEELYLKVLSMSPSFEETLLNLSAVYFNTKDYKKAFETLDKCNITFTDPKYKTFFPAILNGYANDVIRRQKDAKVVQKITDIQKTEGKLRSCYLDSKNKKIDFEQYLINY